MCLSYQRRYLIVFTLLEVPRNVSVREVVSPVYIGIVFKLFLKMASVDFPNPFLSLKKV